MTLDRLAWFIGETARPVALLIAIICAGASSIILSVKLAATSDGSMLVAAIWLGATSIFLGKAAEEFGKNRNASKTAIAASQAPAPSQGDAP